MYVVDKATSVSKSGQDIHAKESQINGFQGPALHSLFLSFYLPLANVCGYWGMQDCFPGDPEYYPAPNFGSDMPKAQPNPEGGRPSQKENLTSQCFPQLMSTY